MDNRGEDRKGFAEKRSFRKNDGERGERRFERSDNFKPRRFERDGERRDFKKTDSVLAAAKERAALAVWVNSSTSITTSCIS